MVSSVSGRAEPPARHSIRLFEQDGPHQAVIESLIWKVAYNCIRSA